MSRVRDGTLEAGCYYVWMMGLKRGTKGMNREEKEWSHDWRKACSVWCI